jgi:hypothetical protein
VGKQVGAMIMARRMSHIIYNIILKSHEWLTMNCVMNVTRMILLGFYIFRGDMMRDDYIKQCKSGTCMAMLAKTWMTTFLFKEFLSFFKRLIPSVISH